MSDSIQRAIARKIESFPAMSQNSSRVLELLRDPDATAAEVESEMRYDPGQTANVLKLANSAYFGFAGSISTVRDAVIRMGTMRVYQLMVTSFVDSVMNVAVPGYDAQPGEMLRHSLAVSVAAECLTDELDLPEREEVFTAAVLHDVGKLILGEFVQDNFDDVTAVTSQGESFDAAERDVLGIDHAEAGALVLESWSLPARLVSATRWHHHPEMLDPPEVMVDVVHVADMLSMSMGFNGGREGLRYRISPDVIRRLGLRAEQLELVAMLTVEKAEELAEALGVDS